MTVQKPTTVFFRARKVVECMLFKRDEIFWIEGLHVGQFDCQHNKLTTYKMLKYIREISLVPRRSLSALERVRSTRKDLGTIW